MGGFRRPFAHLQTWSALVPSKKGLRTGCRICLNDRVAVELQRDIRLHDLVSRSKDLVPDFPITRPAHAASGPERFAVPIEDQIVDERVAVEPEFGVGRPVALVAALEFPAPGEIIVVVLLPGGRRIPEIVGVRRPLRRPPPGVAWRNSCS